MEFLLKFNFIKTLILNGGMGSWPHNNGKTLIFNLMNNTLSSEDEGYGCNSRS